MHITNLAYPARIALIGMPRSGSTIMSSIFNSVDGGFVVGEPHAMVRVQRPPGMSHIPTIMDTRYGTFQIRPGNDVLSQLVAIAEHVELKSDIRMLCVGFKECWVPVVEPIQLVKNYLHAGRLSHIIICVRDPRKNYASIVARQFGVKGMSPEEFTDKYVKLIDYGMTGHSMVKMMIFERFIQDPLGEAMRATGFDISGEPELKMYAGGGDEAARVAKEVRNYDHREPVDGVDYAVHMYKEAVEYESF
jgi:hypothetical protein